MNLDIKHIALFMMVFTLFLGLTACSSNDDSPLNALQTSDNYTKTIYNDDHEDNLTQVLKVDGDKIYYEIPSGSLYITYERGFFYFLSRNQTMIAYVDEYNTGNYQKVELEEDPVEYYIMLEEISFDDHFESSNEIYRLKEEYLTADFFKNLGDLNDVFLKFENDTIIFTFFIDKVVGESLVQIIYSNINETEVITPQ